MACPICGEDRFANAAQSSCHTSKNHAQLSCSCSKKFMTPEELKEHQQTQEALAKDLKCSKCCRSFNKENELNSHKMAKSHWEPEERKAAQENSGKVFCDDTCGRSFGSKDALKDHTNHFRSKAGMEHACHDCTKAFPEPGRLDQHKKDTGHKAKPRDAAKNYIDKFMKVGNVHVDKADNKASKEVVKNVLDPVIKHVRGQDGGEIYSPCIRKAGSTAVKAKIGRADEFDTNIPLEVKVKEVKTRGSLPYVYEDKITPKKDGHSPNNLKVARVLVDNPDGKIDIGRARVLVDGDKVPANVVYKGDLIAHKVQEDFHRKVGKALKELDMKNVHLSRNAHGPANTLTIKQPNGHDINVDLTPTLPCKEPVTHNGWPRPDTKKAFSSDVIDAVKDAGMHVVPKGGEAWTMSYSKAEKALLGKIDQGNGCRRNALKYCKRETEKCASRTGWGLPGVSSHILKHSLLWSCEKHHDDGYWHQRNMNRCLIDTMKDTEGALRCGKLPNYFNTMENVLKGKDRGVLNTLADHFKQERMKLIHLQD